MSGRADPAAVEAAARAFLGTPYVHRASLAGAGCDCVGLARGVWRAVVGPEPAVPAYPEGGPGDRQALVRGLARHMIALPAPEVGVLVVLRMSDRAGPMHCGVITGRGSLIHALPRAGVVEAPWGPAFARRLAAVFAFPAATPGGAG